MTVLTTARKGDSNAKLSNPTDRKSSQEQGDMFDLPEYHATTGRPIRRSAGKMRRRDGYVDSNIIAEADQEISELSSEEEREEEEEDMMDGDDLEEDEEEEEETSDIGMGGMQLKKKRNMLPLKKRKRTPSPPAPALDPIYRPEVMDIGSDTDVASDTDESPLPPINLQINVPIGFHGPLIVKLDRSLLGAEAQVQKLPSRRIRQEAKSPPPEFARPPSSPRATAFTDMPPELRNKIYRYLFLNGFPCQFPADRHLGRGAQILSTCRLVHSEGCSVLYGENKYVFDRTKSTRGQFWEPNHREIGYTDIRRFLNMIGPENLCYLRDVRLVLDDATPSSTPFLSHEERRYINDEHLIEVLRILRGAKLREFSLSFLGRRLLSPADTRFIRYLQQIKTDTLINSNTVRWYPNKISMWVFTQLREKMERKEKLYADI